MKKRLPHYLLLVIPFWGIISCQQPPLSDQVTTDLLRLNACLHKNSNTIDQQTDRNIAKIEEIAFDKTYYQIIVDKTKEIQLITDTVDHWLNKLQEQLIDLSCPFCLPENAAQLHNKMLVQKLFSSISNDPFQQSFLTTLDKKIQDLKKNYLSFIGNLWLKNTPIKGTIFADINKKETFLEHLKEAIDFNYSILNSSRTATNEAWNKDKTVLELLSLFRIVQNEIKRAENTVVNSLTGQVGRISTGCGWFHFSNSSSKQRIRLGETYQTDLMIYYDYYSNNLDLTVNGLPIKTEKGKNVYRVKPTTIGEQRYVVKALVKNKMTHKTEIASKTFYFDVRP